jgi:hypothetical protein
LPDQLCTRTGETDRVAVALLRQRLLCPKDDRSHPATLVICHHAVTGTIAISDAILQYDEQIEHIARTERPEMAQLKQVTGVGTLTALTFVLTISDPYRFAKSR